MPAIDVYFKDELFAGYDWRRFRSELCKEAANLFSIAKRDLKGEDFSVTFHSVTSPSSITQDVIIRVQLHAYPEQTRNSDAMAHELATSMGAVLRYGKKRGLSLGVSIILAEIGWDVEIV